MKLLKSVFLLVGVFLIVICITACLNNRKQPNKLVDVTESVSINENHNNEYSKILSSVTSNENGIYSLESANFKDDDSYIITSEDTEKYFSLLNFIDYKTNKKIILCNKPNCSHNSSVCNAFVESHFSPKEDNGGKKFSLMDFEGFVITYNNKLYVLDPFGDLFVMNKDGSNRTKLLSIDSKYSINNGFLYRDCVYLCVKYLPSYDGNIEQEFSDEDYNIGILRINLKNSKYTEVLSFKTEIETTCLGIYENKVYFYYRSPNKLVSANNQQIVDNEENNHNVSLYYYDLSKAEREYLIKNIKSYEMDDIAFDKGAVYYHNRKEEKIIGLDLKTGEKYDVLTNISGYIEIYTPIDDNKLYFMKDNQLANAFSSEIQINEKYCVDLNTGDVNKVTDIN